MKKFCACSGALLVMTAGAAAQVIEDFEHGNLSLYTMQTSGANLSFTGGAAYMGNLGAEFGATPAGWWTRFDVPTEPGNEYAVNVRARSPIGNTRSYLGVGATSGGTISAVFGPNTNQILLQQNTGFGFSTLTSTAVAWDPDTWYVLTVNWEFDGTMTVSLWDEAMTTLLAQTVPYPTGMVAPGGLAIRGFAALGGFHDMDEIRVLNGDPPCYANCDGSTMEPILTVDDFTCFINEFAAAQALPHEQQVTHYANCDGSTTMPALTVDDFTCFINEFAAGCP